MILPNQLTVLRIILTPVFYLLFRTGEPLFVQISMGVYIVAAFTDWYDGWLARKFNYITEWGKFLDPLADKILNSAAFFAFVYLDILPLWMVIIIVIRDFLITGLRAFADYQNVSFITRNSAKWKTFLQMAFINYLLFVYTFSITEVIYVGNEHIFQILMGENIIYYSMLFVTLVTLYTGIEYIYKNLSLIKRMFNYET
ncbi:MAG: CDP-diacylglycerol--glycerol-3-phosphate 3-phosphatidyltransferase [Bacteroidetes bacterium]|nr:CDP-diacylglycerol--glycerol-3-phosphate 3-phosphatidyltransferase [Bacteroidota bacterium]MBU1113875.1 CDP-diacylglycerol--glycerol-3-phosphate 3-phosphatidyltransferase [Bacteroidota bacterium]MBU1798099.1 CDP-diacylglycerol--glycerol-3-phosphate 3-phosphatidyltransferase [Bacteroidota bacterium]